MSERVIAWSALASAGVHVLGLAAGSSFVPAPHAPARIVPIEIVTVQPSLPPAPAPVERRTVSGPTAGRRSKPPKRAEPREQARLAPEIPQLLAPDAPALEPPVARPDVPRATLPATSLVPSVVAGVPGPVEGAGAGAGELFATGDIGVRPGEGTAAGSGAAGRAGAGLSPSGRSEGRPVARPAEAHPGGAPTAFARPLGGYQTQPRYPDSARRQGIEGVTLLRFEVLATGRVGTMLVDRSAGHADLDRAAMDAVRTWRFEPARRGEEPVTVWVTLPVRFELRAP
jgi:protein TonB